MKTRRYPEDGTGVLIADLIGQTIQREGRWEGLTVSLVRLGGCNLACTWCDVPYSWDYDGKLGVAYPRDKTSGFLSVTELAGWATQTKRLVISGGEPLLQDEPLRMLTDQIAQRIPTEIETNGTISPQDFTEHVHFAVSPKLTNSGNPWNRAIKPNVLAELNERNASFKFALSNPNQIREVRQLQHEIGIHSERIWIMPEARYPAEILAKMEWLTLDAEAHGWNVSTRLLGLTDYTESETEE